MMRAVVATVSSLAALDHLVAVPATIGGLDTDRRRDRLGAPLLPADHASYLSSPPRGSSLAARLLCSFGLASLPFLWAVPALCKPWSGLAATPLRSALLPCMRTMIGLAAIYL